MGADSWKFRNYRADEETAFSVADAVALFGDEAVCVEASGGCTPTPAAAEWIAMVAHSMSFGSCEGMTVTSLDRFLVGARPSSGQLPFSPDVARQVSRLFATQYLQKVIDATDDWRDESVAAIVTELEAALADKSHEQYTLGVYTKGEGHSVLPYAVDRLEEGRAVIHVYDPNWPSQDRYIEVDTDQNAWRFSYSGRDPASDPEAWTGGSKKMDLQPLSSREAPHEEPFEGAGAGNRVLLAVTSTDRNWALTAGDTTTKGAELVPGEDAVVAVIRAGLDGATTALIEVAVEDSGDIRLEAADEVTVTAQAPTGTTTVAAKKQVSLQISASEGELEVAVSKDADAVVSVATESERIFVESSDRLDTDIQVTEVQTVVDYVDDLGGVVEEVVVEAGESRVDIEVVIEESIVEVLDEQGEVVETVVIEAETEFSEPEVYAAEVREEVLVIATPTTTTSTTEPPAMTTSTSEPPATTTESPATTTSTTESPATTTSTTEPPATTTSTTEPPATTTEPPATTTEPPVTTTEPPATTTSTTEAPTSTTEPPATTTSTTEPPATTTSTTEAPTTTTEPPATSTTEPPAPVVPTTVPGAPTGLSAAPGTMEALVTWTAPLDTGGSPIIDYVVEYSTDAGTTWTTFEDAVSAQASFTFSSETLITGGPYELRVSAVNVAGAGPTSQTSTLPTVPATITDATVTAVGDQSMTATFTAPANGGSAITGYTFEYSTDGGSTWTVDEDPFTLTFSGSTGTYSTTYVTNGTAYSGRVSATNAVGSSPTSNVVTFTPVGVPGSPTGLAATTPAAPDVSLSWSAPTETGGGTITDYAIEYSDNGGSSWTTFADGTAASLGATVTGLTKGTSYTFRVSAINAAGTGTASSTVQAAIPTTVPGAPTDLTAAATSGVDYSIDLAWTAPNDDGGSSLTDYIIEWQFEGGDWWTVGPSDLTRDSMTDTSVTVGYLYSSGYVHIFRVTSVNAVGSSTASSTASGTPTPIGPPA